MYRFWY